MKKRFMALLGFFAPIILIITIIFYRTHIDWDPIVYFNAVANMGTLLVGLGALIASYQYAFPLFIYQYYADQLEDEDIWWTIISSHPENTYNLVTIISRFERGHGIWHDDLPSLCDHLRFKINTSNMSNHFLRKKFDIFKIALIESVDHVASHSVKGEAYRESEEVNGQQKFQKVVNSYNDITGYIRRKSVPEWIRRMVEGKFHLTPSKVPMLSEFHKNSSHEN